MSIPAPHPSCQRGKQNLITDVPGILVGNAQNDQIKTGTTVVTALAPFRAAVSILGGAPGTRETELLDSDRLVEYIDAIVLSGGSAFGLDAASAAVDYLKAQSRGYPVGDVRVPIVPTAVIFDLHNGGDKHWLNNPYPALGKAACQSLAPTFRLGSHGAGTGATTATVKGGLGSASVAFSDGHTLGALAVVNPYGSVTLPDSGNFWAAPFEMEQEFGGHTNKDWAQSSKLYQTKTLASNTTLAIIATDYALDKAALKRLSIAAHDGIARAIVPAHTPFDGDLVFAISTGRQTAQPDSHTQAWLGHQAALCLSRAIARGVYAARPQPGDRQPTWYCRYAPSGSNSRRKGGKACDEKIN